MRFCALTVEEVEARDGQGHSGRELQHHDLVLGSLIFRGATRQLTRKGHGAHGDPSLPSCLGTQEPDSGVTKAPCLW